jgi:hypothetical protein
VIRSLACLVALHVLAVVSGCATTEPFGGKAKEQQVAERAKARWQHLIKGEFAEAYGFATPSYRSGVSEQQYRSGFKPGLWRSAEVKSVSCDERDVCRVEVEIDFQYAAKLGGPVSGKSALRETWRKDVGEWWHVPDMR